MARYVNRRKKYYSDREKRAFSAGRGYAAAKAGRRVQCKSKAEKFSFLNGFHSVK